MSESEKYRVSMEMDARDLAVIIGGVATNMLSGRFKVAGVSTDSRQIKAGDAFFAIEGEKFDGHDFVDEAMRKGAVLSVVSRQIGKFPQVVVGDTVSALGTLAAKIRKGLKTKVIAVTGSNGKTTTRNMLYSILSRAGKTVKSEDNFNNEIGLPITIMKIPKDAAFAVVELGMNRVGEIRKLTNITAPDAGLITNIGPAHLEFFEDVGKIAEAKGELFESMGEGTVVAVNLDDRMVMKQSKRFRGRKFTYSFSDTSADLFYEYSDKGEDGLRMKFITKDSDFESDLNFLGSHNATNAAAAASLALAIGISKTAVSSGLAGAKGEEKRLEIIHLKNGVLLVNDCYNANPVSTEAALETVSRIGEDRHFVFGDMLELGKQSPSLHESIGKIAGKLGFKKLYLIGQFAPFVRKGALSGSVDERFVKIFGEHSEIFEELKRSLKKGSVVLIKGSRGMKMEEVSERLLKEYGRY